MHVRALGLGGAAGRYPADLMTAYRRLIDDAVIAAAVGQTLALFAPSISCDTRLQFARR